MSPFRIKLFRQASLSTEQLIISVFLFFVYSSQSVEEMPETGRDDEDGESMTNLSEDIEERLCTLWDMSANQVE